MSYSNPVKYVSVEMLTQLPFKFNIPTASLDHFITKTCLIYKFAKKPTNQVNLMEQPTYTYIPYRENYMDKPAPGIPIDDTIIHNKRTRIGRLDIVTPFESNYLNRASGDIYDFIRGFYMRGDCIVGIARGDTSARGFLILWPFNVDDKNAIDFTIHPLYSHINNLHEKMKEGNAPHTPLNIIANYISKL